MAQRIITLNEILDMCDAFTQNHPTLRDFDYGDSSSIGTEKQMNHPFMWATHNQPSYINVENRANTPELNLMFIFMDKLNIQDGTTNTREIMSDMFQTVQDFVLEITTKWGAYGIKILENASIMPVFDDTTDKASGWTLELNLKLMYYNC